LSYIASSRPAWAISWDPISNKKQVNKKPSKRQWRGSKYITHTHVHTHTHTHTQNNNEPTKYCLKKKGERKGVKGMHLWNYCNETLVLLMHAKKIHIKIKKYISW
jgi:hypothetical protein